MSSGRVRWAIVNLNSVNGGFCSFRYRIDNRLGRLADNLSRDKGFGWLARGLYDMGLCRQQPPSAQAGKKPEGICQRQNIKACRACGHKRKKAAGSHADKAMPPPLFRKAGQQRSRQKGTKNNRTGLSQSNHFRRKQPLHRRHFRALLIKRHSAMCASGSLFAIGFLPTVKNFFRPEMCQ